MQKGSYTVVEKRRRVLNLRGRFLVFCRIDFVFNISK